MRIIFWCCAAIITYTVFGYYIVLRLVISCLKSSTGQPSGTPAPRVLGISVVVPCYNEERVIRQRIENLLAMDYPREQLEIIVASDGSTDETSSIAKEYVQSGVTTLDLARGGRALAHNAAVAKARGDIVIFTDADTEFDTEFARVIVGHFLRDDNIGCVAAHLLWKTDSAPLSKFTGLYWRLEQDIRKAEGRLGILANAPGPAMAIRRVLWKPMTDSLDDCDSITPLDVILQGYRVEFAEDAVAYEVPFSTAKSSFRAKVRGVSKSVIMITRRWGLRNIVRHPLYSWRMLSHHFLRWLAPYFILAAFVSCFFLLNQGFVYQAVFSVGLISALLVLAGYFANRFNKHVLVASHLFSFAIVNAGFALGVLKGLAGAARGEYETE